MFASPFDVFDALHGVRDPHGPAKRHRLAPHAFAALTPQLHQVAACSATCDRNPNASFVFHPEVVETEGGFLITALVPGVGAGDISITAVQGESQHAPRDRVLIRSAKHKHVFANLSLPDGKLVEVGHITASCIDGVFRVVVPKTKPFSERVQVGDGGLDETRDGDDGGDGNKNAKTFALAVPGFNHNDISVTIERPTNVLVITGDKEGTSTKFEKRFKLNGSDGAVAAFCAHGELMVTISPQPSPPPVVVPVVTSTPILPAPPDGAEQLGHDEVTVLRRAVPGFPASTFQVTAVSENGAQTLRVLATDDESGNSRVGRRAVSVTAALPARLDLSTLRACLVDGIITVTAQTPHPVENREIYVSKDVVAALTPDAETPNALLVDLESTKKA